METLVDLHLRFALLSHIVKTLSCLDEARYIVNTKEVLVCLNLLSTSTNLGRTIEC